MFYIFFMLHKGLIRDLVGGTVGSILDPLKHKGSNGYANSDSQSLGGGFSLGPFSIGGGFSSASSSAIANGGGSASASANAGAQGSGYDGYGGSNANAQAIANANAQGKFANKNVYL